MGIFHWSHTLDDSEAGAPWTLFLKFLAIFFLCYKYLDSGYEFGSVMWALAGGWWYRWEGFPDSSVGKESTCNAGDPCSIPGSGRFPWRRARLPTPVFLGFPCGSVGKESACKAADPSLIPGLGRSAGEGIGYPLQYPWASLVAQLVKNPPAVRESWVWFLGWKDPLEKGKATHSSILAWRIPWTV